MSFDANIPKNKVGQASVDNSGGKGLLTPHVLPDPNSDKENNNEMVKT